MMPPLSAFVELVSDWTLAILGVLGTGVLGLVGIVSRNHFRSKQNERRLVGDPDDPNHDGVLQISRSNGEKIDKLEDTLREHHSDFMQRVEEMNDD